MTGDPSELASLGWRDPSDGEVDAIVRRTRSIAIVGVSPRRTRPSHEVAHYLLATGELEVWFVNPMVAEIDGRPCYRSLADLPVVPDLVDVFRRRDELPSVTDDAIAIGATTLWFQLGLRHDGAGARAVRAGLELVMDRCLKVEHIRSHGR